MSNNSYISTPPFKDPQLLNFAKQVLNAIGNNGSNTAVGSGPPQILRETKEGDTYWNYTDNNWWIFHSNQWTQLNTGFTVDTTSGAITDYNGNIYSWLYKYLSVKYADDDQGGGISNSPTNKTYYGLSNSDSSTESSNPADYLWFPVTGGFGTTKVLWYLVTGGRQIQFQVAVTSPGTGWVADLGIAVDLDVVTSGNIPVIAEAFITYFSLPTIQVPRTGNPLTPSFTGINPTLFATDKGAIVPFVAAQTDSDSSFVNNSWRIGNSSTTGYADISHTNLTIGDPTVDGNSAKFPAPTAMSASPVSIVVPIRYKSSLGVVTQASIATCQLLFSDPGAQGSAGPVVDFSGYTSFVQNAGGAYTPTNATLSAIALNITSPTYSWAVTGATPTFGTSSTINITPTSSATSVSVTLTVSGSNISSPLSVTKVLPVVYDGAVGQAGSNGVMSAFPTIYQWTTSSTAPTRPTTITNYTWSSGAYTAPSGWSTTAPTNITPGSYLWSITIPLNVSATTTISTLDWTNVAYPIRAVAYNGTNGTNGTDGTNGATGSSGSATFLVTRTANDSSAPTNAEVVTAIGRNPVAGDIATVSYNNGNNAVVYRYVTSWVLQTSYITGSLIVQNTITGDKIAANTITSTNIDSRNLTIKDSSGNVLLGAGTNLNYANITPSSGWLNSNVTMNANGTLSGAGSGQVTLSGIGYTGATDATRNNVTYATTAPSSPVAGDIWIDTTNAQYIIKVYNAGVWKNSSNLTTNTNQLTDGANLGQTATWSFVTGSNKPADNATKNVVTYSSTTPTSPTSGDIWVDTSASTYTIKVYISGTWQTGSNLTTNTNQLTDGANLGQTATWSYVTGTGKPADNATVGAQSGVNLKDSTGVLLADNSIKNNVITINADGTLNNAGSGQVTLGGIGAGAFATLNQLTSSNVSTYIAGAAIGTAQVGVLTAGNIGAQTIDASKIAANTITAGQIAAATITGTQIAANTVSSTNIDSRNLTIKDSSGNILLGAGTNLAATYINPASGWLNSNISLASNGALSGAGGGQVTISGLGYNGALDATRNNLTYSSIAPTSPANGDIWIDITTSPYITKVYSGGSWQLAANYTTNTNQLTDGANLGLTANYSYLAGTPPSTIANSAISINSNGSLSGAGGGQVTANGINAVATDLSNAPSGILNSNITLGTLGGGAFATLNKITSSNVSTYIDGASIGTAQVGVLTANNIGAGTIDASKIAANTIWTQNLQVGPSGTPPTISGTTMTGSGAVINSNGTFALGTAATNFSYNGSQLTLNGNLVNTGNISNNAVTVASAYSDPSGQFASLSTYPSYQVLVYKVAFNTGSTTTIPVFVAASMIAVATGYPLTDATLAIYWSPYNMPLGMPASYPITAVGSSYLSQPVGYFYTNTINAFGLTNISGTVYFYLAVTGTPTASYSGNGIDCQGRVLSLTGYKK